MSTKICPKCKDVKSFSEFWKNKSRPDGLQTWCKPCWYEKTKEVLDGPNRDKHLRARKNGNLKRSYGISIEEYEKLFNDQDGVCSICRMPEKGSNQYGNKRLAVDHCHSTGKVRGLLCQNCNRGIGMFADDKDLLKKAIEYLEHWY